jgi:type I restriction enzyme M protein
VNLDIFWLRDDSQDDDASLDDPDVIALEMVEDLRAVLEELEAIAADLASAEEIAAT